VLDPTDTGHAGAPSVLKSRLLQLPLGCRNLLNAGLELPADQEMICR